MKKILPSLKTRISLKNSSFSFTKIQKFYFSETATAKAPEQPNPQSDLNKVQLNQKYKEMLKDLKSDWKSISVQKEAELNNNINDSLIKEQKDYVEVLAQKFLDLNIAQINFVVKTLEEKSRKLTSLPFISFNNDWPKSFDETKPAEEQFKEQQELMSQLIKWFVTQSGQSFGFGGGVAASSAASEAPKAEAKKEEVKQKEIFDIELSGFDATKKINIIKEIRAITNLGLKEAKELVEKAPTVISKQIKKEEAEAIQKKLTDAGATIKLI